MTTELHPQTIAGRTVEAPDASGLRSRVVWTIAGMTAEELDEVLGLATALRPDLAGPGAPGGRDAP